MTPLRRVFRLSVRRRELAEAELNEEIRTHLAMRVDRLVARGMSRSDAEAEALRRFGPMDTARAELLAAARRRDERLTMLERLDTLRQDVRYAVHQIRRAPALAVAIVATFALGIGANATMFGIVDRLLLRAPTHVAAPEQLVRIETHFHWHDEDVQNSGFSYPSYTDFRDHVPGFASVAMYTSGGNVSLGRGPDARQIKGMLVSGNYFRTLGVHAALGRTILPDDDRLPNGTPVVVIGNGLWRREFGASRAVIGRGIVIGRQQYTIVGVAPREFVGIRSRPIDVWIPVSTAGETNFAGPQWATERNASWMSVIARVPPTQSLAVAAQQATVAYQAGQAGTRRGADSLARVELQSILPHRQAKLSPERRVAALLAVVSAFVLLIACANVANLLLVRGVRRRREIAVRVALGISRLRLVRQLLTESVLLALAGGVAALAVVRWGSALVEDTLLSDFAWPDSPLDGRVLAFTGLAATVVGVLAGLVPALQNYAGALTGVLKEGTRGAGLARSRTRTALLLTQAALSTVLLIGAGLFVRSLRNVNGVDLGLDLPRLLIGWSDLRSAGFDTTVTRTYFEEARARVARIPGVEHAVLADGAPMSGWSLGAPIRGDGIDTVRLEKANGPNRSIVGADYFATVGTRIVRGRALRDDDVRRGAAPVVVINETAARLLWPKLDPLGRCVYIGEKDKDPACRTIVGIARDTHRGGIVEEEPDYLQVYLPHEQTVGHLPARSLIIRARDGVDPESLMEPIRRTMQSVLPNLPYANVQPMSAQLASELRSWQLGAMMFGAFGTIALFLSALGLYSVVAHTVAQRTHEMGVRIALGARGGDIARLVLGTGFRIAVVGVLLGTAVALAAASIVKPLLYNVSPRDPLVLGSAVLTLVVAAALASLGPARRASRADPLTSLRSD